MVRIPTRLMILTVFIILLAAVSPAVAGTEIVCDFESTSENPLENLDPVSALADLYVGVTFSGDPSVCIAATGPNGYNNLAFPPYSGDNVVAFHYPGSASGEGKLTATFTTPASLVRVYYHSTESVYLVAYDNNNNEIDSDTKVSDTDGTNPPNQDLHFVEVTGSNIDHVTFNGVNGETVIDDFTFVPLDVPIPEFPSVAIPVAAVLGLVFIFGRRKM